MLIAGDIGGTKTLLALYDPAQGPRRPVAQDEFPSARYEGLESMVEEFLGRHRARAHAACFDVAGPVIDGRAQLTNLPWILEEKALCSRLGLERATLLNDLRAIAHAVPHLQADELRTIKPGRACERNTAANPAWEDLRVDPSFSVVLPCRYPRVVGLIGCNKRTAR